jgi:tRNA-(ms[2]io[6]A)-hydroxylase
MQALLSDHLHCERKAAENALHLVRRYPHRGQTAEILSRLAHEETSHVVQVALLLDERGLQALPDTPNLYARGLFAEVRGSEPERMLDLLLVAAFIEARSHERLCRLAEGFDTTGEAGLAELYGTLARAEDRHAEIFLELAEPLVSAEALAARREHFANVEAALIDGLPHACRVH